MPQSRVTYDTWFRISPFFCISLLVSLSLQHYPNLFFPLPFCVPHPLTIFVFYFERSKTLDSIGHGVKGPPFFVLLWGEGGGEVKAKSSQILHMFPQRVPNSTSLLSHILCGKCCPPFTYIHELKGTNTIYTSK